MATGALKVSYLLQFAPDFKEWPKRTIMRGTEHGLAALGQHWYRVFFQKHFTNLALQEYGYARREKDYAIDKAKFEKRTEPMVGISKGAHVAGQLKRQAMRTGLVRATSKRVNVQFQVPAYARIRSRGGAGPDLIAELTTISKREVSTFIKIFEKVLVRFLRGEPKRKRVRSGAK